MCESDLFPSTARDKNPAGRSNSDSRNTVKQRSSSQNAPSPRWRRKTKVKLIASLAVLLALVLGVLCVPPDSGKLTLPVGKGTPAISLGERHGLILASDGSLWSWGSDFLGWPLLGVGNSPMTSTILRQIGRETDWASISAGASHSLAIKSDGTLWTWGESVEARFVRGRSLPSPVSAAPGNDWKQAAAGGIHSVALKRNGTLWAWGNNWAGSVGISSSNGSSVPVQVGSATNWVKVWASMLETVGLQADGSLWYWGDNPDPAFGQDVGRISAPARVSPDTNWMDVGFGVNTMFAIKSDGTLWAWGRQAHVYTEAKDPTQDTTPTRVGADSDWQSISAAAGWWCQGLVKKDGSLWMMDASDGEPNGPRPPYKPVRFRRAGFERECAAYAAGAVHAAAPGVHGPVYVLLTSRGEVWTRGMILGDPQGVVGRTGTAVAKIANSIHIRIPPPAPPPVFREVPWQLRHE